MFNGANDGNVHANRHRLSRLFFNSLLFCASVILLGLTAQRIHWTRKFLGGYERIIAELLVTAILGMIVTVFVLHGVIFKSARETAELFTLLTVWLMSLVGAAILTHDWENLGCSGAFNECHIMQGVKAFAWIVWALTSLLLLLLFLGWSNTAGATTSGKGGRVMGTANDNPATV